MLLQVITKFLKKIESYTIRCRILKAVSGYIVGYDPFYLDKQVLPQSAPSMRAT
uniref:Uncharacterized protein n=1 Tax=Arundo donax TaxID=35708 RepID=A0A0A9EE12_ARUDO